VVTVKVHHQRSEVHHRFHSRFHYFGEKNVYTTYAREKRRSFLNVRAVVRQNADGGIFSVVSDRRQYYHIMAEICCRITMDAETCRNIASVAHGVNSVQQKLHVCTNFCIVYDTKFNDYLALQELDLDRISFERFVA